MRASGLSHLTSVSGANCAIMTACVVYLLRWNRVPFRLQAVAALGVIIAFVLLCGPEASVLRASVMGGVTSLGLLAGRGKNPLSVLAVAVLILLAADPWLSVSIGFMLSAAATAGIIVWGGPLTERLSAWVPVPLAAAFSVTACASAACQPILAFLSDNVPGLTLAANMLAAPLVGPITVLGFGVVALAWAWPEGAAILAWLPNRGADVVVLIARWAAHSPTNQTDLPVGPTGAVLGMGVCVFLTLWLRQPPRQRREDWTLRPPSRGSASRWVLTALAGVLALLLWAVPTQRGVLRDWQAAACDVGQGDAFAVRTGPSSALLVDAGPRDGRVDACLRRLGVTSLTGVFISHLHEDHVGGLSEALRGRGSPPVYFSSSVSNEAARRILPVSAHRLDRSQAGRLLASDAGVQLWLVHAGSPAPPERGGGERESLDGENHASMVLLAVLQTPEGPMSILFTGDLEKGSGARLSQALRQAGGTDRVDVVKVAHHGAKNGASDHLPQAGASLALIGVGAANDYGHPHKAALAELGSLGIPVKRTDQNGMVTVRRTRQGLEVQSDR